MTAVLQFVNMWTMDARGGMMDRPHKMGVLAGRVLYPVPMAAPKKGWLEKALYIIQKCLAFFFEKLTLLTYETSKIAELKDNVKEFSALVSKDAAYANMNTLDQLEAQPDDNVTLAAISGSRLFTIPKKEVDSAFVTFFVRLGMFSLEENRVEQLKNDVANLRASISKKEVDKYADLVNAVDSKKKELEAAAIEFENETKNVKKVKKEFEAESAKVQKVKIEIENLTNRKLAIESQINELKIELDNAKIILEENKKEIDLRTAELERKKEELALINTDIKSKSEDFSRIKQMVDEVLDLANSTREKFAGDFKPLLNKSSL